MLRGVPHRRHLVVAGLLLALAVSTAGAQRLRIAQWTISEPGSADAIIEALQDREAFLERQASEPVRIDARGLTDDLDALQNLDLLVLDGDPALIRQTCRAWGGRSVATEFGLAVLSKRAIVSHQWIANAALVATVEADSDAELQLLAVRLPGDGPPAARVELLRSILAEALPAAAVALAGNLETTGRDGSGFSLRRAAEARLRSPRFWAAQAVEAATDLGLAFGLTTAFASRVRANRNPTAADIAVIGQNPEARLFELLAAHAFELETANEAHATGYAPTRPYRGLGDWDVGEKVEWFAVRGARASNARTLRAPGESLRYPLSRHHPISVELGGL